MSNWQLDSDVDPVQPRSRTRRALILMVASVLTITGAGVAYAHPTLSLAQLGGTPRAAAAPTNAYVVAGSDFVNASTGWVVAQFGNGDFSVLRTSNGGGKWSQQLSGTTGGHAVYLKFFDPSSGVFGVLGSHAVFYRTSDGGLSWTSVGAAGDAASVLSLSFTDPQHGWMLVARSTAPSSTILYRTLDEGASWTNLGAPVKAPDQAFRVQFKNATAGWLDTVSAGPYAYRSQDGGRTWLKVTLPPPAQGWPRSGQFFVAAQPTHQDGVAVTIANFAPVSGRSGVGGTVVRYPPLTLRTFDGGVPVTYAYATFSDLLTNTSIGDGRRFRALATQAPAPNQLELTSLDAGQTWSQVWAPAASGAIGFSDAWNWWWVGSGLWSRSDDGGTSWSPQRSIGVPAPLPGSLQVLDSDHAWFASATTPWPALVTTADGGFEWRMVALPAIADRPTP